jgi:hypothetical protein
MFLAYSVTYVSVDTRLGIRQCRMFFYGGFGVFAGMTRSIGWKLGFDFDFALILGVFYVKVF